MSNTASRRTPVPLNWLDAGRWAQRIDAGRLDGEWGGFFRDGLWGNVKQGWREVNSSNDSPKQILAAGENNKNLEQPGKQWLSEMHSQCTVWMVGSVQVDVKPDNQREVFVRITALEINTHVRT